MYDHPALHKMKENRDIRLLCVDVSNNLGFSCKCCKRTIDGILNCFTVLSSLFYIHVFVIHIDRYVNNQNNSRKACTCITICVNLLFKLFCKIKCFSMNCSLNFLIINAIHVGAQQYTS